MKDGVVKKAQREGRVRITFSNGSHSDYDTVEQALSAAVVEPTGAVALELEEEPGGRVIAGDELAHMVDLRRRSQVVSELLRVDPRMEELNVKLSAVTWEADDHAHFAFTGYGPSLAKPILADRLITQNPEAIADALIKWVAYEIEYRRRNQG